jgi:pimeloyl-ACP methyl ester carboxylesterase
MPDATIDGVNIHYNEIGEGEPLLLIMGYGMPGDARTQALLAAV